MRNELVEIGISEYSGLASLSIRFVEDATYWSSDSEYFRYKNLAEIWIDRNWENLLSAVRENTYHEQLNRIGTFSNGNGVFERAN